MPPNPLIGPIAPIIGAIVGAILGALFTWYRSRTKPQYLVCEEKARTSLELELAEEVREATEILYGGVKVNRLSLEKLRLFNQGPKVLEGVNFTVRFNPEVKIVGVLPCKIVPEGDGEIVFPWQEQPPNQNEKKFHVDYLNPFKSYKQDVIIDLICDGKINEVNVFGGGAGWTVKFWSIEEKKQMGRQILLTRLPFQLVFVILVWASLTVKPLGESILASPPLLLLLFALWVVTITIGPLLRWIHRRRYGISF